MFRRLLTGLALALCVPAAAAYDPPSTLAAPPAPQAGRQALLAALPPGAQPLLGPLALPFGAHRDGWLLALRTAEDGHALWYAAAAEGGWRLLRLRDPQPVDEDLQWSPRAAFAIGPEGSRDLVVLEAFARAAPAGGARQQGGTVYRRVGDGAQPVPALSARLDGVADEAEARRRLAPAYAALLPTARGELARAFEHLPLRHVDLTRLERLQRLQPGDPLYDVHDPANGYLRTRGEGGQPAYVLALFRHADGGPLLALQRRWPQAQHTVLLRPGGAEGWQDVTAQLLPGLDPAADLTLPQRGRRITLADGRAWDWDGRRFVPAQAPRQ